MPIFLARLWVRSRSCKEECDIFNLRKSMPLSFITLRSCSDSEDGPIVTISLVSLIILDRSEATYIQLTVLDSEKASFKPLCHNLDDKFSLLLRKPSLTNTDK